jgi:hypothetical protein
MLMIKHMVVVPSLPMSARLPGTERKSLLRASFLALVCCTLVLAGGARAALAQPQQNYIWWEAETPTKTNFPPIEANDFKPDNETEAAALSEKKWIGTGKDRPETLFLEYEVTTPQAGTYAFYARKFWQHGPFRWQVDGGKWTEVRNTALLDSTPIRKFLEVNWVAAGTVELTQGKHTLRIELLQNTGATAFDVFVLTTQPFTPRGSMKPGQKYDRAPAGWFPFEPDYDSFKPNPIDLRYLNEKFAGEGGFIQVKGGNFVHEKTGSAVRFWGVNCGREALNLDRASVALMARSLSKQGVNAIRITTGLWDTDIKQVDKELLDKLFFFVGAMKKEGIYTCLSTYFPLWLQFNEQSLFQGYKESYLGKNPFAILFFNPEFQTMYRGWWKTIMTTPNPYTGVPLARDPAVAMLEIVNEDSYFFHTFSQDNVPPQQIEILEKQFGDWLTERYGTFAQALNKWGVKKYRDDGAPFEGIYTRGVGGDVPYQDWDTFRQWGFTKIRDDLTTGRAGIMPAWNMANRKDQRAQDTVLFLTLQQRDFFKRTVDYLKKDLGFQGSIYGSNWITADPRILGPLDRYSNTAADFMAQQGYYSPAHEGERASFSISKGDRYANGSVLLLPTKKVGGQETVAEPPIVRDISYNHMPSIITETSWVPPNRYRADMPLVQAAYGSLQGTDGFFFFATASPTWEQFIQKFSIRTPVAMGQFPAAALIYRKGLVKPGEPIIDANLNLNDLVALKGGPSYNDTVSSQPARNESPTTELKQVDSVPSIDPRAFLVGQVQINFTDKPEKSRVANLSQYVDKDGGTVFSNTGELMWSYLKGAAALNASQAQALTGFLGAVGTVDLRDVTITSDMEYGTITLVALDDQPLSTSTRMLLQVMSEENNYGWKVSEAMSGGMREITNAGTSPIVVKDLAGRVVLKRVDADKLKVTALDFNGYKLKELGVAKEIVLDSKTLYYLIEK